MEYAKIVLIHEYIILIVSTYLRTCHDPKDKTIPPSNYTRYTKKILGKL